MVNTIHLLRAVMCLVLLLTGSGLADDRERQLTPQEQKVIDYLLSDWGKDCSITSVGMAKDCSITSVDIAMDALRIKQSDETRFRIGSYIKSHPELHEVIRRFGWVTLVLTPDEKLIARALINAEREERPIPSVAEIAKAVGVSESQVKNGLAMLERYEIVKKDGSAGYRVVARYIKWEPRLDFLFHKVTLASGRQFDTNCSVDFMQLVSSKFAVEKVVIDDSSPESTARIHVVFNKGKFISADPASTIVFYGGT